MRSLYRLLIQAAALLAAVFVVWWLLRNLNSNLRESNIPTDFDFLTEPTGFRITDNAGFTSNLPFWRLILIGIQNTLLAGGVGILIATIVGVLVGIGRLSTNWLVAKTTLVFVETLRNIPPLCVILFFWSALFVFGPLPVFSNARELSLPFTDDNWLVLSNARIGIPSLRVDSHTFIFWILFLILLAISAGIWVWRTRFSNTTGRPHHRVAWSLGTLVVGTIIVFAALGGPYSWSWPDVSENGRRLVGGFGASDGYLALTLALAFYTSTHIAEIVRGSIQAVPKGQSEAAYALNSFQRYRFVVLPQAMRIAFPPTINQYLNLVKNTSLGIAVAYPDTANLIRTGIGNGNPSPQSIVIMMGVFLTISLLISTFGNAYNRFFLSRELVKSK